MRKNSNRRSSRLRRIIFCAAVAAAVAVPVAHAYYFLGSWVPHVLRAGSPAVKRAVGALVTRENGKLVAGPMTRSLEVHTGVVTALSMAAVWPKDPVTLGPDEVLKVEICQTSPNGQCTDSLGGGGGSEFSSSSDEGHIVWMDMDPEAMFANTDPERFEDQPSETDSKQPKAVLETEKPNAVGERAPSNIRTLYNALLDAGGSKEYDTGSGATASTWTYEAVGPLPEFLAALDQNKPCLGPQADVPPGSGYTKVNCYGDEENAYAIWRSEPKLRQCPAGYENFGTNACRLVAEVEVKKSEEKMPCEVLQDGGRFRMDDKNPECEKSSDLIEVSSDGKKLTVNNGGSGSERNSMSVEKKADGGLKVRSEFGGNRYAEYDLGPYDPSLGGMPILGSSEGTISGGGPGSGDGDGSGSGDGSGPGSGSGSGGGDGSGDGDGSGECAEGDEDCGPPGLEETPTAAQILEPILTLLPDFQDLNINLPPGECPVANFHVFESDFVVDYHCELLSENSGLLTQVMMLVFSISSILVVLRA